ncbi:hypothetical protein C0J52_08673 [Blattella germanica]|nr:hypothetical protein C0J52_08673 [Blattella germanica]
MDREVGVCVVHNDSVLTSARKAKYSFLWFPDSSNDEDTRFFFLFEVSLIDLSHSLDVSKFGVWLFVSSLFSVLAFLKSESLSVPDSISDETVGGPVTQAPIFCGCMICIENFEHPNQKMQYSFFSLNKFINTIKRSVYNTYNSRESKDQYTLEQEVNKQKKSAGNTVRSLASKYFHGDLAEKTLICLIFFNVVFLSIYTLLQWFCYTQYTFWKDSTGIPKDLHPGTLNGFNRPNP